MRNNDGFTTPHISLPEENSSPNYHRYKTILERVHRSRAPSPLCVGSTSPSPVRSDLTSTDGSNDFVRTLPPPFVKMKELRTAVIDVEQSTVDL